MNPPLDEGLSPDDILEAQAAFDDADAIRVVLRMARESAAGLTPDSDITERVAIYKTMIAARVAPGDVEMVLKIIQKAAGISRGSLKKEYETLRKAASPRSKHMADAGPASPATLGAEEKEKVRAEAEVSAASVIALGQARLGAAYALAQDLFGITGEETTYLAALLSNVSALSIQPFSLHLYGQSSSGKSYTVECAMAFFDPPSVFAVSGMSARALIYTSRDFRHMRLFLIDANSITSSGTPENPNQGVIFLRTLLSEGRIEYTVTEKMESGGFQAVTIVKDGPISTVLCRSGGKFDHDLGTRLIYLEADSSAEQTKRVISTIASRILVGRPMLSPLNEAKRPTSAEALKPWRAYDRWLASNGPFRVAVPFADLLMDAFDHAAPEARRHFSALTYAIAASAIYHLPERERLADGVLVATVDDYEIARDLFDATASRAQPDDIVATRKIMPTLKALRLALLHPWLLDPKKPRPESACGASWASVIEAAKRDDGPWPGTGPAAVLGVAAAAAEMGNAQAMAPTVETSYRTLARVMRDELGLKVDHKTVKRHIEVGTRLEIVDMNNPEVMRGGQSSRVALGFARSPVIEGVTLPTGAEVRARIAAREG